METMAFGIIIVYDAMSLIKRPSEIKVS